MVKIGKDGYVAATRKISEAAALVKEIQDIREVYIPGDPLWVIAFALKTLDIYQIMDYLTARGWSLNGLHHPACV